MLDHLHGGITETGAAVLVAALLALMLIPAPEPDPARRMVRRRNVWRFLLGHRPIEMPGRGTAAVMALAADGIIEWHRPAMDRDLVIERIAVDPLLRPFIHHRPGPSFTWVDAERMADEAVERDLLARAGNPTAADFTDAEVAR